MGKRSDRRLLVYLPLVVFATFVVAVAPLLLVLWLRTSGTVTSGWAGTGIGAACSFLASYAAGALWKTRRHSRDILFNDLMLWGWVQRWRNERRLIAAADVLGLPEERPQSVVDPRRTNEQKAGVLKRLTAALEARDPYTYGHSRRVARHAATVAKRMGLPRADVARIRAAGAMHDVGKARTPTAVLRKAGALTPEEHAIMNRHPVDGAVMVSSLEDAELTAMVRHHHERLDGKGYPDGLRGEAIPLGARILAVADTFDAITSTRPYRQAHTHKEALDILQAGAGSQHDPDAVRAFCSCYSGLRPLALWTMLAHGRPRLATVLGEGTATASTGSLASLTAAATTTAAVGVAALGLGVAAPSSPPSAIARAGVGASPTPSATTRPRTILPPVSVAPRPKAPKPTPSARGAARPERSSPPAAAEREPKLVRAARDDTRTNGASSVKRASAPTRPSAAAPTARGERAAASGTGAPSEVRTEEQGKADAEAKRAAERREKAEAKAKRKAEAKAERQAKSEAKAKAKADDARSRADAEAKREAKAKAERDVKAERKADANAERQAKADAKTKTDDD